MYLAFSASSHAAARATTTLLGGSVFVFKEVDASLSSSSLLAQAAMLILPSCVPRTIISRLVFICSSFSDNSFMLRFRLSLCRSVKVDAGEALGGVEGREELGLRIGVVALTGVPVLDGSWLAIGVISVPISLIDTDRAVEGGGTNVVSFWIARDELCWLRLTVQKKWVLLPCNIF